MERSAGADARIVDRGYQHYRGPRLGPAHAMRAMIWAALRRAMGVRRALAFKLIPGLLILVAWGDVLTLASNARAVSSALAYAGVYADMSIVYMLFAGVTAPTLLCTDRRERVVSLYFASPITRTQYIGAQGGGLALLLLLLTLVPVVLLFAANAFLSPSAGSYLHNHLGNLGRILLGGCILALYYAAVSMVCAVLTDRHAYATGAYLGVMLVSFVAGRTLSQTLTFPGHERFALVDVANLPVHALRAWYGMPHDAFLTDSIPDLGAAYMAAALGVIVGSLILVVWRYTRLRD